MSQSLNRVQGYGTESDVRPVWIDYDQCISDKDIRQYLKHVDERTVLSYRRIDATKCVTPCVTEKTRFTCRPSKHSLHGKYPTFGVFIFQVDNIDAKKNIQVSYNLKRISASSPNNDNKPYIEGRANSTNPQYGDIQPLPTLPSTYGVTEQLLWADRLCFKNPRVHAILSKFSSPKKVHGATTATYGQGCVLYVNNKSSNCSAHKNAIFKDISGSQIFDARTRYFYFLVDMRKCQSLYDVTFGLSIIPDQLSNQRVIAAPPTLVPSQADRQQAEMLIPRSKVMELLEARHQQNTTRSKETTEIRKDDFGLLDELLKMDSDIDCVNLRFKADVNALLKQTPSEEELFNEWVQTSEIVVRNNLVYFISHPPSGKQQRTFKLLEVGYEFYNPLGILSPVISYFDNDLVGAPNFRYTSPQGFAQGQPTTNTIQLKIQSQTTGQVYKIDIQKDCVRFVTTTPQGKTLTSVAEIFAFNMYMRKPKVPKPVVKGNYNLLLALYLLSYQNTFVNVIHRDHPSYTLESPLVHDPKQVFPISNQIYTAIGKPRGGHREGDLEDLGGVVPDNVLPSVVADDGEVDGTTSVEQVEAEENNNNVQTETPSEEGLIAQLLQDRFVEYDHSDMMIGSRVDFKPTHTIQDEIEAKTKEITKDIQKSWQTGIEHIHKSWNQWIQTNPCHM